MRNAKTGKRNRILFQFIGGHILRKFTHLPEIIKVSHFNLPWRITDYFIQITV